MALDAADLEQIGKLIAENNKAQAAEANKVLDAQLAKLTKGLQTETTKQFEALKTETEKRLEGLKVEPPKDDPKTGDKTDIENSPAFKKLQAEVEASKKQAAEQAKLREQSEQKRAAELLTNSTRDALLAHGADPKRVHQALPFLQASGRVKLDGEGKPVMVFQRNGYEETLSVADGAKEWLGTEDGKLYVPPVGTQGTGGGIGGGGKPAGPTTNPLDIVLGALSGM